MMLDLMRAADGRRTSVASAVGTPPTQICLSGPTVCVEQSLINNQSCMHW